MIFATFNNFQKSGEYLTTFEVPKQKSFFLTDIAAELQLQYLPNLKKNWSITKKSLGQEIVDFLLRCPEAFQVLTDWRLLKIHHRLCKTCGLFGSLVPGVFSFLESREVQESISCRTTK